MLKAKLAQRQAEVIVAPFQALYAVPGRLAIPATGEAKRVQLLTETIEPGARGAHRAEGGCQGLPLRQVPVFPRGRRCCRARFLCSATARSSARASCRCCHRPRSMSWLRRRRPGQGPSCPSRGEAGETGLISSSQDRQPQLSPDGQEHA